MTNQVRALLGATGGGTGFGAKYTSPALLPPSNGIDVAFSPSGKTIAVAHYAGTCISTYPFDEASGIGARHNLPASTVSGNNGWAIGFSPTGLSVVIGLQLNPFVAGWGWSDVAGFGSRLAVNAARPASAVYGLDFHPGGQAIAFATSSSPFFQVHSYSDTTGIGAKYANPAALPSGAGNDVAFSPDGSLIAVAHNLGAQIKLYPFDLSSGIGAAYADPVSSVTANSATLNRSIAFSPDGTCLAISGVNSGMADVYQVSSSGFGSKFTGSAALSGTKTGVAFSRSGLTIATAADVSPFITADKWGSISGYGSRFANPASLPPNGRKVVWHPGGTAIAITCDSVSPYFNVYPFSE